jgi:hypothetical protein
VVSARAVNGSNDLRASEKFPFRGGVTKQRVRHSKRLRGFISAKAAMLKTAKKGEPEDMKLGCDG